ncbi:nitrilase-related carbon-nitrogen hydrolase [Polyangium sp. y55x31]|uniref:nitrilase-related carbon-nitrogen hydrolase n=1 Tax=Polyangium sp. y55x31 TaxID=3042688 RepID=UPI00248214B9|nr:nitrilase-related carbon-nitrogen hydrolase [Polyangium sp. y55x31]MDI1479234.1 nitrilase-related carbon-nitrogen hydrolase [Polyangium sp. y55x31]
MVATPPLKTLSSGPMRWVILALGAAALCFSNGVHASVVAAWVAPALILRFVMMSPARSGFAATAVVCGVASFVTFRGAIPMPDAEYAVTSVISGVFGAVPYLLHRLAAARLGAVPGSLVFPAANVTLLYVVSLGSPFGTWANDAYVQLDFLLLSELASVTGLWGIPFLVAWFGSAVQGLFESRAPRANPALVAFGACLLLALGYGAWARYTPLPARQTVRVAALSNPSTLSDFFFEGCPQREDITCRAEKSRTRLDTLFTMSKTAAENGARVIVWYEGAAQYDEGFEPEFVTRAEDFTRRHGVHLVAGALQVPRDPGARMTNKAMVFTPEGRLAFEYVKSIPVPGEPIVAGNGQVQTLDTPYGRLGVIICFDADFPALGRKAAQQGVDLLLVPANDWRAITPLHGEMTVFRAIEGGFSLVRSASNGLSIATDARGVRLGSNDSFTSPGAIMYADAPIAGHMTMYARFGDAFAALCALSLAALMAGAIGSAFRGRARRAPGSGDGVNAA